MSQLGLESWTFCGSRYRNKVDDDITISSLQLLALMSSIRHMGYRELNDDPSHAKQAFTWYVRWATSDMAADTRHHCSGSANFPSTGVDRYACRCPCTVHSLDTVVRRSSHASSIGLWFCDVMPPPWQWQTAGWGRAWDSDHPFPIYPPALPHHVFYSCLSALTWQAKRMLTWLDIASVILTHSGSVNCRGKMMYVTTTHDIVARRYRRVNSVLWYHSIERSTMIS